MFKTDKSRKSNWGFLGGSGVKNTLASAGDTGSIPDWEDPHATEQLRPWATPTKPVLWSLGATTTEARMP